MSSSLVATILAGVVSLLFMATAERVPSLRFQAVSLAVALGFFLLPFTYAFHEVAWIRDNGPISFASGPLGDWYQRTVLTLYSRNFVPPKD